MTPPIKGTLTDLRQNKITVQKAIIDIQSHYLDKMKAYERKIAKLECERVEMYEKMQKEKKEFRKYKNKVIKVASCS